MFDDDDLRRIAGDTDDSMRSLQVRLLAEVALRLALLAESAVGNAELPSEDVRMGHGGKREGAGRKPRGEAAASIKVTVKLTEAEAAELTGGMRDGETLAQLLRDGGLRLVRARRTPETP